MVNNGQTRKEFKERLEGSFGLLRILTLGLEPATLPIMGVDNYSLDRVVSSHTVGEAQKDLDEAQSALQKGEAGLNVVVATSLAEAKPLIERRVPLILYLGGFDITAILDSYRAGCFDCVWEPDDLALSVYYAYHAGKEAYESGGRLNVYDVRKQQKFVVMANKDPRWPRSISPNSGEIKKDCRSYGFVVKDVGSNIDHVLPLIGVLNPKKVLINPALVKKPKPDDEEAYLREIVSTASTMNPDSSVTFIVDGSPTTAVTNMMAGNLADILRRPSSTEHLIKGHLLRDRVVPYGEYIKRITEPMPAYWAGRAFHPQIEQRFEELSWSHTQTQQLVSLVQVAYARFLELVQQQLQGMGRPIVRFEDEECAEGILDRLDPNKIYDMPVEIWKVTDTHSAWQLYFDAKKARETKGNFQQPKVMVPIPLSDDISFLVEEAIIGPTVRDMLDRAWKCGEGYRHAAQAFKDAIYEIELERLLFFQEHFTKLSIIPGKPLLPLDILSSPQHVIGEYVKHFVEAFEHRSLYTDVKFTQEEIKEIRAILEGSQMNTFITPDTLRRNLAATFRNSIIQTNPAHPESVTFPIFFEYISNRGRIDVPKLRGMMYRVDQAPKFSFVLEDAWEMLDFYDARLDEGEKERRIASVIGHYPTIRTHLEQGNLPIRLYRNMREADLFLSLYGQKKLFGKLQAGVIDEPTFEARMGGYKDVIRVHDGIALEVARSLPENHPLRALLPSLERAASFTKIDYSVAPQTK